MQAMASSSSSSHRPTTTAKTASLCSLETAKGAHTFTIRDYNLHSGLGAGKYIRSKRFTVGGHDWSIRYYPDGDDNSADEEEEEECRDDHVAVQLELMSEVTNKVRLVYEFRLVRDQADDTQSDSIFKSSTVFTAESSQSSLCGTSRFMEKSRLEHRYLWDDCLVIECDVTVIKESQLSETPAITPYRFGVQVPPSNLSDDLEKWFLGGTEVDIAIKVRNEVFRAHRLVLAMRSPIFRGQLYGNGTASARDIKRPDTITVEDMEPAVFRALLQFVYTDTLREEYQTEEMATNLFAAAEKYKMERMKLYCGSILSRRLTVQSVTAVIALAHQHKCQELKEACIQFIISSKRRMTDVLSSDGYRRLQVDCPQVALEIVLKSEMFKVAIGKQGSEEGPSYDAPVPGEARWDASPNHD